jgi:hypothetical protein
MRQDFRRLRLTISYRSLFLALCGSAIGNATASACGYLNRYYRVPPPICPLKGFMQFFQLSFLL